MSAGFSETQVELPPRNLAEGLIGQIRTFGPDGPVYQVVQLLDAATAKIRILFGCCFTPKWLKMNLFCRHPFPCSAMTTTCCRTTPMKRIR